MSEQCQNGDCNKPARYGIMIIDGPIVPVCAHCAVVNYQALSENHSKLITKLRAENAELRKGLKNVVLESGLIDDDENRVHTKYWTKKLNIRCLERPDKQPAQVEVEE